MILPEREVFQMSNESLRLIFWTNKKELILTFESFSPLQEVCKSLKRELEHVEHLDDDLNTLDELEEDAIEVKPELQRTENLANRSLRNSTVVDDDPDGKKQFRFT